MKDLEVHSGILITKVFEYKIKKRKAIKAEQLPPLEKTWAFKCKEGDPRYIQTKKETNRNCHVCGGEAIVVCWFQLPGCQKIERYCAECLDKWVIVDESIIPT
jgi:hypothetical protein